MIFFLLSECVLNKYIFTELRLRAKYWVLQLVIDVMVMNRML